MIVVKENINVLENLDLSNLWQSGLQQNMALALWRLPNTSDFHFLIDTTGKPKKVKVNFEDNKSGFCFSSFLNNTGNETLLLNNDFYAIFSGNESKTEPKIINGKNEYLDQLLNKSIKPETSGSEKVNLSIIEENDTKEFEQKIELAKESIKKGFFQKVVLSRCKKVKVKGEIDIVKVFKKLAILYPKAFVSAVYLPESNEIWLGASPELLVSIDNLGIFRTMSLAGTQAKITESGHEIPLSQARWSQKEIEEQAFVSRYIIDCFKKVRVREYTENGPKTVEAGNLMHLQTDFSVDTKFINFSEFATVLLELLHPTSAVCGMPKENALAFILANENYDRNYYSGFLGPINIKNESNIFVNLRTMKLAKNMAYFYAGAGITEDSIPKNEWIETEMKMQTLLNVLYA